MMTAAQESLNLSGPGKTKDSLDHFIGKIRAYHQTRRPGSLVVKPGASFIATPTEGAAELVDLVDGQQMPRETFAFRDEDRYPIILTPHTLAQLLSTLGVRSKWFRQAPAQQMVDEISQRNHLLQSQMFKIVALGDGLIARGLVSKSYTSVDDTDVVDAIRAKYPTGVKVNAAGSFKTHESMNLVMYSRNNLVIPGSRAKVRAATVVRNSEVGTTSLWIIPALCINDSAPVILKSKAILRRSHRGSSRQMRAALGDALDKAAVFHEGLASKMHLLTHTLGDISTVLDFLDGLHVRFKATKAVTLKFKQGFEKLHKSSGKKVYTLFDVLDSVVVTLSTLPKGEGMSGAADLAGGLFAHALTL